ncbi:MAG: SDR family NAD(P)-dependent oxidoreductase [bacterium]|nr:SDR family NAD(P)-dependent oxidoreductase [bacterium]
MKQLKGRVVAISGAGSGIGRALAQEFARHGARLSLCDINLDAVTATADALAREGVEVMTQRVDVGSREDVAAWAEATRSRFGSCNIVVNNAGVALSGAVPALRIEDYEWIMRINFWGVIYGTKAFLPLLEASGEGHIVNISSVFGLTAQPLMSGYNASKFAVRGFTESLRQDLELASSCVSATCVHPGGIKTNIAKAARVDASVSALTGRPAAEATREFELSFFTTPERAAGIIVNAVRRNRRRVLVGPDARLYDWMARLLPSFYQRIFTAVVRMRSRPATGSQK